MELGPGLLESVYEVLMMHALRQRRMSVERQVPIPIHYHGIRFEEGFRADLIIEQKVILELKSVERVTRLSQISLFMTIKLLHNQCPKEEISKACGSGRDGAQE
jgi:GxxExxY protein